MANRRTDKPGKVIDKTGFNKSTWLEITTLNILPGEEVSIQLTDKNNSQLQANKKEIVFSATVDNTGKAIALVESDKENSSSENKLKNTGLFKKGWWALDQTGEKPINRAVPGMTVYFHIETTIPDGEEVHIELFEDDNNEEEESGTGDKDDHMGLINSDGEYVRRWSVKNGKVVANITLNTTTWLDTEIDRQIELYFRCSYQEENVELPESPKEYLVVGTLVIDRYKVPGLNGSGTDIADDLTYGTGYPQNNPIYKDGQVPKYKVEYEDSGFNEKNHALFTNKKDLPAVTSAITPLTTEEEPAKPQKNKFSLIIEEATTKQDNTYVHTPPVLDLNKIASAATQLANKNLKAKYSKEELYKVKTQSEYDSGSDLKEFNEGESPITGKWRDDDYLFWNFKNTAELWFARGELQGNINRMIAKFKSNTGGIYEDPILTKNIKNHPVTLRYCMYMENYIAEKIKQETLKNLTKVEDKEPDFENQRRKRIDKDKIKGNDILSDERELVPITRPAYSVKGMGFVEASKGLTIALNDIWATEVILKELKNNGDEYTAKYEVTLWDHFGLDITDMQEMFNTIPSIKEAFASWFVLQHLRGYKPFVTKITFTKEFKGNIHEGREERRAKLKAKEQALIQAEKLRAQQRTWDKAINPFSGGLK